jgi:hypothetical protein
MRWKKIDICLEFLFCNILYFFTLGIKLSAYFSIDAKLVIAFHSSFSFFFLCAKHGSNKVAVIPTLSFSREAILQLI